MKKIIAKEFLLLIIGIVFGVVFLGSISLYKNYLKNQNLKFDNEIYSKDEKLKELNLKINESYYFRQYVYRFLTTYYGVNQMPSADDFNVKLNNIEYIKLIYENIEDINESIRNKEIKIIYPYDELSYDLKNFELKIRENNTSKLEIDADKLYNNMDSLINKKAEIKNSYFYKTSYYNIFLRYSLLFFLLIYVLRYTIIGIRWSIKELNL
jgi:hypothetical protein